MNSKVFIRTLTILGFAICLLLPVTGVQAKAFKVLVVMSYEQDNPWCREIKEGIDSVLAVDSEITYFYMDTKVDPGNGPDKAQEAFALFQTLQPDGVITADDNAQSMLVVPHLKDKSATPVMFCGVNAEPEKYGYPASNVSGTLERGHIRESIAFIKQLTKPLDKIAFVAKDSPSGRALQAQVEAESGSYLAQVSGVHLVKQTDELQALAAQLNTTSDAVYMDSLEGIEDQDGQGLSHRRLYRLFTAAYRGPVIGANRYHVDQGALSAVVKTGQEQGETAAAMLLKALQGTPVSELPVTRNYKGRRVINVTTMDALGIVPRPIVLRGATLVRTQD